ncbi:TetR/AcrR family transcriptional regulator [bacterium]|nr:TetR/AcrR family transcriptional regulator [bacterium]
MTSDESTRDLLIRCARKRFSEQGFDGTTIKDIVDDAQVNVSLVSYYFNGKEGLFQACIRGVGQANLQASKRILTPAQSIVEFRTKIALFVGEMMSMHIENPDVCRIIHREMDQRMPFMEEIFKSTFMESFNTLASFLTDAQQSGFIRADLSPFIIGTMVIGNIVHFCRIDRHCSQYFDRSISDPKYQQAVVDHISTIITNGSTIPPSV